MLSTPGKSPRLIKISSPTPSQDETPKSSQKLIMGPPPPKRKRKEIVLDEDTYVAAIEKIVERDFFPDIPKLQNRLEWLEAIRTGDPVRIREAQARILRRRGLRAQEFGVTPSLPGTPLSNFGTPGSILEASPAVSLMFQGDGLPENKESIDINMSLDEFLQKYTSEDNASFSAIKESDNKRRAAKQRHFLELESTSELKSEPTSNLIESKSSRKTDGYGSTGQPVGTLISWPYRSKNLLMYDSSDMAEVPLTKEEISERTHGPPKEVVKKNTRFHGNQVSKHSREEDTVAILYTPVSGTTPQASLGERNAHKGSQNYDLEELRRNPQPGQYTFVATPSPAPGVDESPFMTWGEIEGTPLRLEAEDTPIGIGGSSDGPHFKIPAAKPRDEVAHGLSRSAAKSIRDRARIQAGGTRGCHGSIGALTPGKGFGPGLGSPSPRLGGPGSSPSAGLSAAAQRLVDKALKRKHSSVDANLRASYTGNTPGRSHGSSRFYREGSLPFRSPSASPAPPVKITCVKASPAPHD